MDNEQFTRRLDSRKEAFNEILDTLQSVKGPDHTLQVLVVYHLLLLGATASEVLGPDAAALLIAGVLSPTAALWGLRPDSAELKSIHKDAETLCKRASAR